VSFEHLILLALAIPLVGTVLILMSEGRPNQREVVTLTTAVSLFAVVLQLLPEVYAGGRPGITLFEILPGLEIRFEMEPLGMMFACIASGLWIINSIYSIGYMRAHHEQNQTRFYACFAIAIFGALGVATAGNMLTLFIFYEVLTISTYPLVTHSGTTEAKRSGRIYLGLLLGTSIGLQLVAIVWTWFATGTLDFREGGIIDGHLQGAAVGLLLLLYMYGIGKAALMPIHRWLPEAMVAPTPVSALLHAVAVVKAGVFTVLKVIVYIFGAEFLRESGTGDWLMYIAGATVLLASFIAMTKDNLKARLAYSTVSQLSYVILGAALFMPMSVVGGGDAYRHARGRQDHAVLLRRCDLRRPAQDGDFRHEGRRPHHAGDHVLLHDRRAFRHRHSTAWRIMVEVPADGRRGGCRVPVHHRRADPEFAAERRLPDADPPARFHAAAAGCR